MGLLVCPRKALGRAILILEELGGIVGISMVTRQTPCAFKCLPGVVYHGRFCDAVRGTRQVRLNIISRGRLTAWMDT